jgi:hypothetical protein
VSDVPKKEIYVCPKGFSGDYKIFVKRVWGKVAGGKATVDIYTNFGSAKQVKMSQLIEIGEKSALVTFQMGQGRRTEQLADAQVADALNRQVAHSARIQSAFGGRQQVAASRNSWSHYSQSPGQSSYTPGGGGVAPPPSDDPSGTLFGRGGGVGFTIRPTILPTGALMSASAVISADRRYVRVSPFPFFSSIGEVNTFNVAGPGSNNTGGGTGT